jgi:hypothetical protein
MVRAKFRVTSIAKTVQWNDPTKVEANQVELQPVMDDNNKGWSKYTPCGSLKMQINNPEALDQFEIGKCYFLDFTPAPQKEADEK